MTTNGQSLTKQSYEDPQLVAKYIQKHALETKHIELIKEFATHIDGKKVLDLGCGPGHHSYIFSQLGFDVTGLDYSSEMIKQAKKEDKTHAINFVIGDMTKLESYFEHNTFNAVWAAASLLHIPSDKIDSVLTGIADVSKPNAYVFISLKGGTGTHIVSEDQYLEGMKVEREFTLWEKAAFLEHTKRHCIELEDYKEREGRVFQGKPTKWLQFCFRVKK